MTTELAHGPLHPDLFEPEPTPTVLAIDRCDPRWRAEVMVPHPVQIEVQDDHTDSFAAVLRRVIDELVECHAPARWEILGGSTDSCCHPMRIVHVGLVHQLDIAAQDSHQALDIAQALAARRWPGSEVLGVDLVLPEEERQ